MLSPSTIPPCGIADEAVPAYAEALTSHGYGVSADRVTAILLRLSPEERYDLMYACYRAAEKIGPDAFCA